MPNPPFRDLPDHELERFSDDELLDYIRVARAAGNRSAAKRALAFLVFGYMETVRNRVRLKVPEADVEDVASTAVISAIRAAFDGSSMGEFRSFMHTIVDRRIADYHRAKEGKPEVSSLDVLLDEDSQAGPTPSTEHAGEAIDVERAVEQAYGELNPTHQQIVDGYIFEDRAAAGVATATGQSEANVHQVASRFRRRVREILEQGDTSP